MSKTLTAKQRKFVEEYCVDQNATQAAIRAGYSERTAASIGSENLTKPEILGAVVEKFTEHRARCAISIDSLTDELALVQELALEDAKYATVVAAIMAKAKLHGLPDKSRESQFDSDEMIRRLNKGRERLAKLRQEEEGADKETHRARSTAESSSRD